MVGLSPMMKELLRLGNWFESLDMLDLRNGEAWICKGFIRFMWLGLYSRDMALILVWGLSYVLWFQFDDRQVKALAGFLWFWQDAMVCGFLDSRLRHSQVLGFEMCFYNLWVFVVGICCFYEVGYISLFSLLLCNITALFLSSWTLQILKIWKHAAGISWVLCTTVPPVCLYSSSVLLFLLAIFS